MRHLVTVSLKHEAISPVIGGVWVGWQEPLYLFDFYIISVGKLTKFPGSMHSSPEFGFQLYLYIKKFQENYSFVNMSFLIFYLKNSTLR